MNLLIMMVLGVLAIALVAWLCKVFEIWRAKGKVRAYLKRFVQRLGTPPDAIALANAEAEGTHLSGILSKRADGAITTRFLLVKNGSDEDHIALAGAADFPYGLALDEAAAAEDLVQVQSLSCNGTVKLQTDGGGALVAGDFLIPAANGQVKKMAAGVGQQYIVGQVIKAPATVAGTLFEARVMGCFNNTAVS